MKQAFVASTTLRPMAAQLLQDRTPAAYSGVESFARTHAKEDAGALAWLVAGYARIEDHDYAHAIDALSRAKPRAGDLGDYVAYYLGAAYQQTGRPAEALAALANFATNYPESLLTRDAYVTYANALIAEGRAGDAAALLEKDRQPTEADIEVVLGRAYAAMGQKDKATLALRNVYFTMPASPEAETALTELHKLEASGGVAPAGVGLRRTRADLLVRAKRYGEAADEYKALLGDVKGEDRIPVVMAMADALHRGGRNREAKQALAPLAGSGGELNAQRIFLQAQIAWGSSENDLFYRTVDELRQAYPLSPWLEQGLFTAANLHLVHHEFDAARDTFREIFQRFPNGGHSSLAHWKVAWLTYRAGRRAEAATWMEQQVVQYPTGQEVPAALYWRGRLAEDDNDPGLARTCYEKLSARYLNFYYAELARQRLERLAVADPPQPAWITAIPPMSADTRVKATDAPVDDVRVQKARLLGNGALVDFAVRELQAANTNGESWGPAEAAQIYDENNRYDRAMQLMKRTAPGYFSVTLADLPRSYWEALFPKAYWTDLKKYSAANGLDPYLVASLIRQESEFNPVVVSHANAVGLMQLLPRTGKLVAKELKLRNYTAPQLYTPAVNLQLGTKYFRGMVDTFGGKFEYALAAYNAGSDRVAEWSGLGTYRDIPEFVESIPFTETRDYVQAIMRNASVYRQLYGAP
jgi:soluble lytic murein transglycosylase